MGPKNGLFILSHMVLSYFIPILPCMTGQISEITLPLHIVKSNFTYRITSTSNFYMWVIRCWYLLFTCIKFMSHINECPIKKKDAFKTIINKLY